MSVICCCIALNYEISCDTVEVKFGTCFLDGNAVGQDPTCHALKGGIDLTERHGNMCITGYRIAAELLEGGSQDDFRAAGNGGETPGMAFDVFTEHVSGNSGKLGCLTAGVLHEKNA